MVGVALDPAREVRVGERRGHRVVESPHGVADDGHGPPASPPGGIPNAAGKPAADVGFAAGRPRVRHIATHDESAV